MTSQSDEPQRVHSQVPARVFVTGANGFIGRALLTRLRELGSRVTGVDLRPGRDPDVLVGSTTDPDGWMHALDGADAIVHTAAIVSNVATHDQAWAVNVLGTRRVIDAAASSGVPRLLHLSSIMAYGFDYPDGVDETYPVRVNGYSYTDSRVNSEAVVMAAHACGEVDATIVRPGDVIGPGSIWVREPILMSRRWQMILPAMGNGVFTPVYIDNLVDALVLALATPASSGQIFTVTDGYGVACRDYFGRLATMANGTMTAVPTGVALRLSRATGSLLRSTGRHSELGAATALMLARRGLYSTEKARRVLGFEPRVGYEQAMSLIETWARQEGLI